MDWLTFVSNVVDSTTWPITLIVVVFAFRNPIARLIPLMRSLRIRDRDLEVTFGEGLAKVRAEIDEVPFSREEKLLESAKFSTVEQLTRTHPPAAIIEAWKLIEEELRQLAIRIGRPDLARTPNKVLSEPDSRIKLGSNAERVFHQLHRLRNEAVHQPGLVVSEAQALEYADLAESMAVLLGEFARNELK